MVGSDLLTSCKVGYRTGDAEDFIVAAGREAELVKGGAEHIGACLVQGAVAGQFLGGEAGVRAWGALGGAAAWNAGGKQ